jgi:type IV pilus assembly protein PilB
VTGPTGSGKSTTLYAALQRISTPDVNIITVEDPVEYQLAGVSQMQVNAKAGLTFAAALPAILRSDPDVLLIGEVRDRATAQLAVEAALTGHLVLSTLHTNDAPSAITRLVEMGIEPYLLGSSLVSVLAQRLTRRLCLWCKTEVEPTEAEWEAMNWPETVGQPETLLTPGQCRMCSMTGYSKRVALQESMPMSEVLERMTVSGATTQDIRLQAQDEGMLTLREDGFAKAAQGITSVAEVLRVTV